jgi:hypothetical protein
LAPAPGSKQPFETQKKISAAPAPEETLKSVCGRFPQTGITRETGLEPATSGATGRLEDVYLQRHMELLGQVKLPRGAKWSPSQLRGIPEREGKATA